MGTKTTYYGLNLPAQEDFYNIDIFNANAEIVDEALNNKAEKEHTHLYAGADEAGGKANSAVVADHLSEYTNINLTGGATGTAQDYDGSSDANIEVTALNPDMLSKPVPIGLGGTGATTAEEAKTNLGLNGADGYILTGTGTTTAPEWKVPLIKSGAGENSVIIDPYNNHYAPTATKSGAFAIGLGADATGTYAIAMGSNTVASGVDAMAVNNSEASGSAAFSANNGTANGNNSAAFGYYTEARNYQFVAGKYNVASDGATTMSDTTGDIFIVGVGTNDSNRLNGLVVAADGTCKGVTAFFAGEADLAEMWEWADGNPNNEDRRGLFVTLDGEKIRIANADDFILGAVSATPALLCDARTECWKDRFLTDVYGTPLTETVEVDGHSETCFITNPDYDSSKQYISRTERKEWVAIGYIGKLIVRDDSTCTVNGYCKVSDNGIVTASINGYRVLSRIDDTHIKILIK